MAAQKVADLLKQPKQKPVKVNYNNRPAGQFNMGTATPFKMKAKP